MYKILSAEEIVRLGFNHGDIRRARSCCLRRLSRGVYLVKHVCDQDCHRPLWASIGEKVHGVFVEHGDIRDQAARPKASALARYAMRSDQSTAALMHSLPIAYPVTHQVEVVRPGDNRRFEAINVRGNRIPRAHRTVIGGVEVTTLERTIIDVARSYNLDISVAMLDDALHRGLTTEAKVLETLAQCMEKRNITKVRSAIDLGDARRESPAEAIAAVRFFQHGIT